GGDDDAPKPAATLKNAVRALLDNNLIDIYYDDFLGRAMSGNPAKEWTDQQDLELTIALQGMRGFGRIGLETVRHAAMTIAFRNRRNCVRTYLESLKWDGEARIEHFFEDHFGAAATAYTQAAARNFWISL